MKRHLWWVRRKYTQGWECNVLKRDCYDTREEAREAVDDWSAGGSGNYWGQRGMQRIHKLTTLVDGEL